MQHRCRLYDTTCKTRYQLLFSSIFNMFTVRSKSMTELKSTSASVILIVGTKCTLAASHAAPWWATESMPTGQADGRTPRQTVTLRFPLDATSVTIGNYQKKYRPTMRNSYANCAVKLQFYFFIQTGPQNLRNCTKSYGTTVVLVSRIGNVLNYRIGATLVTMALVLYVHVARLLSVSTSRSAGE